MLSTNKNFQSAYSGYDALFIFERFVGGGSIGTIHLILVPVLPWNH